MSLSRTSTRSPACQREWAVGARTYRSGQGVKRAHPWWLAASSAAQTGTLLHALRPTAKQPHPPSREASTTHPELVRLRPAPHTAALVKAGPERCVGPPARHHARTRQGRLVRSGRRPWGGGRGLGRWWQGRGVHPVLKFGVQTGLLEATAAAPGRDTCHDNVKEGYMKRRRGG